MREVTPVAIRTQCVCDNWGRIYDKKDKRQVSGPPQKPYNCHLAYLNQSELSHILLFLRVFFPCGRSLKPQAVELVSHNAAGGQS